MRELRVEDALIYLDQVKLEFSDKPHIYNEFLEIMKCFKSQDIDTPGVIIRVKTLFRGYDRLILGFNTFLPEGFKISLDDIDPPAEMSSSAAPMQSDAAMTIDTDLPNRLPQSNEQSTLQSMTSNAVASGGGYSMMPTRSKVATTAPVTGYPPIQPRPVPIAVDDDRMDLEQSSSSSSSSSVMQQQHESASGGAGNDNALGDATDGGNGAAGEAGQSSSSSSSSESIISQQQHAINYVTAIRNRFSNDPDTYRTFLRILHTYQREQKGINEVLDQVSRLFADHPDLLMEFTYFLPDAVQDKAKQRLNQAVAEAENRKKARAGGISAASAARKQKVETANARAVQRQAVPPKRPTKRRFEADWSNQPPVTTRHAAAEGTSTSTSTEIHAFHTISAERALFEKIKDVLCSLSHDLWLDFLRCLDLFGQGQLGRKDMMKLLSNIFGPNVELFEEFKNTFNSKTAIDSSAHSQDLWYSLPLSEIDFSQCRKCSPSYRALPRDYPSPRCSARTEAESSMLNDRWVSIPVGSEESYSFKHMRRNTFEDALFKCEDDHFELDMLIDSTMSTIRIFEPIAREILALEKHESGDHVLDSALPTDPTSSSSSSMTVAGDDDRSPHVQPSTDVNTHLSSKMLNDYHFDVKKMSIIHLNTIARVYGDHAGDVLDLLRRNPAATVPVILKRLKQKDTEWRKVRQEMCKTWRDAMERNFSRSLDQRSHYFRQQDKRMVAVRGLLQEIKDIRTEMEGELTAILTSMAVTVQKDSNGHFDPVHTRQQAVLQLTMSRMNQHEQYVRNIQWHKTGVSEQPATRSAMTMDSSSSSSAAAGGGAGSTAWPTLRERIRLPHDVLAHVGTGLVVLPNPSGLTVEEISSLIGFLPQVHIRIRNKCIMSDVFKIIAYAVEQQSLAQLMQQSQASSSNSMTLSGADKDKICVLWRDLLRHIFDIPVHVMFQNESHLLIAASVAGMQPTASDQATTRSLRNSTQQQRQDALSSSSSSSPPSGKMSIGPLDASKEESYEIKTKGIIEDFNVGTSIYRVRLTGFGGNGVNGYLHPSAIISLDGMTSSDLESIGLAECAAGAPRMIEVENVEGGPDVRNMSICLPNVVDFKACRLLQYSGRPTPVVIGDKPKKKAVEPPKPSGRSRRRKMETDVISVEEEKEEVEPLVVNQLRQYMLLGSQNMYVLIRFLAILAERFQMTKDIADDIMTRGMSTGSTIPARHPYSTFLSAMMSLVDGSIDNVKFEEMIKKSFSDGQDETCGSLGYECFFLSTIDKVLQQTVRVLQVVACAPEATSVTNLFRFHNITLPKCRPLHYSSHYASMLVNGVRTSQSSLSSDQGFEANPQAAYEEAFKFNIVPTSVVCKSQRNQGIDMFMSLVGGVKDVADDARVGEGFMKAT